MIVQGAFAKLFTPGLRQAWLAAGLGTGWQQMSSGLYVPPGKAVFPGKMFFLDEPKPDMFTPGRLDPLCAYPPVDYQPEDWPDEPFLW